MSAPRVPGPPRGPLLGFHEGRLAAIRMRDLRRAAGLTQDQLAVKLGQGTAWVARREQGGVRLSVTEAEAVAEVLGTDLAGLTGGTT